MGNTEPKQTGFASLALVTRAASVLAGGAASVFGFRSDAWQNPLTGLGTERDKTQAAEVSPVIPLSESDLTNLFNGDDLARRVVDALPEAAMRQGVRLLPPGDANAADKADAATRLLTVLEESGAYDAVLQAATWGRLYGRAAILLGIEGAGDQSEPFDPAAPGAVLKWFKVLDRRDFSVARVHPDTAAVTHWALSTASSVPVHASRFIMFGGALTSTRDRLTMQYSDYSVLQTCIESIRDVNTVWGSTAHLVSDASQAVYRVKGLFDMLTQGDVNALLTRFAMIDQARSTVRGVVVDADDEDFTRTSTSFAGLPEANQTAFQRLAAAARMPVTVLMGMSPAGLNATGESDTRSWYAEVETYQTNKLTRPLTKLVNLIAQSNNLGSGWAIEWPSLWTMNPTEEASYRKTVAETDALEITNQVLLAEEVAAHRHSGARDAWTTPVPIDLAARNALASTHAVNVAPAGSTEPTQVPAPEPTPGA